MKTIAVATLALFMLAGCITGTDDQCNGGHVKPPPGRPKEAWAPSGGSDDTAVQSVGACLYSLKYTI